MRCLRGGGRALPALLCWFLFATGLFPSQATAETWYESYYKAEQALQRKDWSEAIRHLNQALEERPESSGQARTYGMRFVAYYPYLKLGIAYRNLGQLEAALSAFDTEERQGAVLHSESDYAELKRQREEIASEKAAADADRERRAREVLEQGLSAAKGFEKEGRYEDALASLSRVIAVAPDSEEAKVLRKRLLASLAEKEKRREDDQRIVRLVEDAKADLDSGQYVSAASRLNRALDIREDDQVRALLERAQDRIRAELDAREGEDQRLRFVQESLERATSLEAAGKRDEALAALQALLARDPRNDDARRLQRRIILAQRETEQRARRVETVEQLLIEAEQGLDSRDFDRALRSANRVLALDPANSAALATITRTYALLSDSLLRVDDAPPVIILDDLPEEEGDSVSPHRLRSSKLVLKGTVYDGSPVELSFVIGAETLEPTRVHRKQFSGVWITDFTLEHSLRAGRTTIDIEARDEGGQTAKRAYPVEYVVPFLRSVWFPVSVAGGLSALGLGALGRRAQRRRKLRLRRFNPYVAGAPILAGERFFGRKDLLDYVLRRIHNNSILLYGERRIGKTSFQHQLKKALTELDDPEIEFFPVYVDLQGTPEERFFATLATEISHELSQRFPEIEASLPSDEVSYGYRQFVPYLQLVLKSLKASGKKRAKLVLLIDEVDELNEYDPRVNQRLRSLFMRTFADSLVSVVSGVAIKKQWDREGSPWYNFFQEIEVQPLDRKEATALIEAPVRGIFTFSEGVVEEILRRTNCKPYLVQRICCALVDRLHADERRTFTLGDVDSVCRVEEL